MDSFELNKVLGALLGTVFVVFSVSLVSDAIFASHAPETPGFAIVVPEETEGGAAPEETGPSALELLASADAAAGESVFRRCTACHTAEEGGANRVGPNLYGVVNRPVASHEGFAYSAGMQAFAEGGTNWTFEHLSGFLRSPRNYVQGTSMSFAGISDPQEEANLIAYLNTLSASPAPLPEVAPAAEEEAAPAEGEEAAPADGEEAAPAEGEEAAPTEGEEAAPADAAPAEATPETDGTEAGPTPDAATPAPGSDAAEEPAGETQPAEDAAPADGADDAAPAEDAAPVDEEEDDASAAPADGTDAAAAAPAAGEEAAAAGAGSEALTLLASADAAAGEQFFRRCVACHTVEEGGANRVGPNLYGVVNRPVASAEGFDYSPAMQEFGAAGEVWSFDNLSGYLVDPRGFVPGNRMAFAGIRDPQDEANVLAYLNTLSAEPAPLP